jgi:hypothetical protein
MQLPGLSACLPLSLGLGGLSAGKGSLSSWGNITILILASDAGLLILRLLVKNYNQLGNGNYCSIIGRKAGMMSTFQKVRDAFSWERFAVGILLLLGFILRIRQYLTGRSLWLDEAMLALNILDRDFAGLFQPLDYHQGAPIGFLLVEKILNLMFGDHEFVLRLFPLAAGIASLILFYFLLHRTASGFGLLTGLGLFAVGPALVYYSSELKQYILDVAVTISLLLLVFPFLGKQETKRDYIFLGLGGILALWFSHPALFVSAGIGIVLLLQALKKQERSHLASILLMGALWLANLGLLYYISLRGLREDTFLLDYWQENFIPIPPWSDWSWFKITFSGLVQHQIGLQVSTWLAFVILILGMISLLLKNKPYAGIILGIIVFDVMASALRLYPLGGRFSLFFVPLLILLISQSIDELERRLHVTHNWSKLVALLIGAYLLYTPVTESFNNFINPKYYEHIRPSMATLSENWQAGDRLFVSNGAAPAFRFYAERYGLGDVTYQTSDASDYLEPTKILSHFEPLDGESRVWVLITHVYERGDFNEKDFLLNYLDTIGKKKREFRHPGTSVNLFLYDLNQ